jgi:hypothetical protein
MKSSWREPKTGSGESLTHGRAVDMEATSGVRMSYYYM